ncbi:MAG TPA: rod shape-determining protein MreD [Candidatus Edwardsbacteria bacterium]|nr:rod shape-determining protein MreD [Candidatus Edwardsbacteria bacterium]
MRRGIILVLLVWLLVFLQSSLAGFITVGGFAPDLFCILIPLVGLRMGGMGAMRVGFLAGLLADCYHPATMGIYALCYTVAGFAAGAVRDRIYRDRLASQIAASAVLALLAVPLAVTLRSGGGYVALLVRHGFGSAVYTAAVAALALPPLNRWLFPAGEHT